MPAARKCFQGVPCCAVTHYANRARENNCITSYIMRVPHGSSLLCILPFGPPCVYPALSFEQKRINPNVAATPCQVYWTLRGLASCTFSPALPALRGQCCCPTGRIALCVTRKPTASTPSTTVLASTYRIGRSRPSGCSSCGSGGERGSNVVCTSLGRFAGVS